MCVRKKDRENSFVHVCEHVERAREKEERKSEREGEPYAPEWVCVCVYMRNCVDINARLLRVSSFHAQKDVSAILYARVPRN